VTKPRVLLVADGRSPITRNWIKMMQSGGYPIYLVSTFPYQPIEGLVQQMTIPVGFSSLSGSQVNTGQKQRFSVRKQVIGMFRPALMRLRSVLAPRLLRAPMEKLHTFIVDTKPDIVHALRIPFEGMLCSSVPEGIPFAVSIWGNDLTFHAKTSVLMGNLTRRTLTRADALLADAVRDIELAKEWGLRDHVATSVVPGSGGLDIASIDSSRKYADDVLKQFNIPHDQPLVINPRGFRPGSVHQDIFFQSIPFVLEKMSEVLFLCPGMQDQPAAEKWVQSLGVSSAVHLLPFLPQEDLWALYAASSIYISLSSHDGTPNSFLEAIASGAYPIVGDIASLREWITPGQNGSLLNPRDAQSAAREICGVLGNENLRRYAAKKNRSLVEQRALREVVRRKVDKLYTSLI
jgi:glycosyltransferase involved in cell wall biosynthesis